MEACRRCGSRHPERELVDLWAGRYYWPRPDDQWVRWHEQHAVRVCQPCAEAVWPTLRDALHLAPPVATDHDDHHFPVGAEQGAPRLRPGEEP